MNRRRVLAALSTGVSLSGCLGSDSSSETLAPGESFEASGVTTTLHDVRVQRIVFTRTVHVDPHRRPGQQFLVADASVSDRNQLRDVGVVADGDRVETRRNDGVVAPFEEPTGELLGLAVPAPLDADDGAVTWSGPNGDAACWPLDGDNLHALAHPSAFEVRNFEIPEEVERGSSFAATLAVENAGSGDGTFFSELGATSISDAPEIRVEVPAGETVTAERTVEPHYPESGEELSVVLNWGADRLDRTAKIAD